MDLRIHGLLLLLLAFCSCSYARVAGDPTDTEIKKTNCLDGQISKKFMEGFIQAMIEDQKQPNGEVPAELVETLKKIYGDQFPQDLILTPTNEETISQITEVTSEANAKDNTEVTSQDTTVDIAEDTTISNEDLNDYLILD